MGELEPTLTLRRNETARRRAIARGKYGLTTTTPSVG